MLIENVCMPVRAFVLHLVWFMVFNATFNTQLYREDQFYWRRKLEYPEKTTDLSQVIDKRFINSKRAFFSYIMARPRYIQLEVDDIRPSRSRSQ
jgi:hypothetical protein